MPRLPITPQGYQKLKDDLERFKKIERPMNIKAIEEARAHGDLSENAEYHAAKERQSFIEGKIKDLGDKIARSQVIDPSTLEHDKVAFGARVTLLDLDSDEEVTYQLVGEEEADLKVGRISMTSPVGRALMGRRAGEEVTIKVPARTLEYEVVSIEY